MMIYLDTNIFIYTTDKESPKHKVCVSLIKTANKKRIQLVTSTESIQEVIHLAQNMKRLQKGLQTSWFICEKINSLLPINTDVIGNYLTLVKKYPSRKSRDVLHLAAAVTNKIDTIITYDADFQKFKEVKAMTPKEYLDTIIS